jgi:hypothetical protein
MNSGIFLTLPIFFNMFKAASLAPPCKGPHRAEKPEAIEAKGLTPDEAASLTVEVEAFCS